jgi:hypothetical protein
MEDKCEAEGRWTLSGRGGPSGFSGRRLSLLTSNLSLLTFQAELG